MTRPRTAAFTPVPRRNDRHDGWTPARQIGFIAALADTGCVSRAARSVNMTPESVYALRRAPGAETFRAAWTAALAEGVQRLTDVAFERALEGVAVPIFHKGEQVGERRAYNDRLLMFTLRHHDKGQYGDGSNRANAISPATRQRLRAEWSAEREAVSAETRNRRAQKMIRDDLLAAVKISDKLSLMRERMELGDEEPRLPSGEYDSPFRRELEAYDRLYPHVQDYTAEDVGEGEGWPAANLTPPPAPDPDWDDDVDGEGDGVLNGEGEGEGEGEGANVKEGEGGTTGADPDARRGDGAQSQDRAVPPAAAAPDRSPPVSPPPAPRPRKPYKPRTPKPRI